MLAFIGGFFVGCLFSVVSMLLLALWQVARAGYFDE